MEPIPENCCQKCPVETVFSAKRTAMTLLKYGVRRAGWQDPSWVGDKE